MKCQTCGFENPAGSKICAKCGSWQTPVCRSCGRPAGKGMKYCAHCGLPLVPRADKEEAQVEKTMLRIDEDEPLTQIVEKPPLPYPYLMREGGRKIEIEKDKMTIGRSDNNDLVLISPEVSGRHSSLEKTNEGWLLSDLHSTNGTFLNDRAISSSLLQDGDRIRIGKEKFIFHDKPEAYDPFVTRIFNKMQTEVPVTIIREKSELPVESAALEPAVPPAPTSAPQSGLTAEAVQKLGKKMEKGIPSPIYRTPPLSPVLFSDETLTWAGTCESEWYFGPNQSRELYVAVTPLRFILYYKAESGTDACQSYWYNVDFGGHTWKSGFKTWRGFTVAAPEIKKKKIELFPQEIRVDGKIKTLFAAMPLEDLKVPEIEGEEIILKKDSEAFFAVIRQSYETRKAVDPLALLTIMNDPLKAAKIPGAII